MAEPQKPEVGSIFWRDLTVGNAEELRDFYAQVVGWTCTDHPMGACNDYNMNRPRAGETVAGICHAQGPNAGRPPQWLIYIMVEDVEQSARKCVELGGRVVDGPRSMGEGRFCVVQDPARAVAALISQ